MNIQKINKYINKKYIIYIYIYIEINIKIIYYYFNITIAKNDKQRQIGLLGPQVHL